MTPAPRANDYVSAICHFSVCKHAQANPNRSNDCSMELWLGIEYRKHEWAQHGQGKRLVQSNIVPNHNTNSERDIMKLENYEVHNYALR